MIAKCLDEYVEPLAHTGPVRRVGLMVGFDLLRDPEAGVHFDTDARVAHQAVMHAREEGVVIRPLGDTMVLMPAPAMPGPLVERVVEVTARAVDAATRAAL